MKKEIELKILNIDPKKLKKVIKKIGGERILKPTLIREFYLKSPSKKRVYSSFRLRSEGKFNFLTIKIKKDDPQFEVRDEYEIKLNDIDSARKILELLGFKVFRQREKIRESYRIGGARIEIDIYPGMKPYAEIESTNTKDTKKLLKRLGFMFKYTTKKTASEIILDAGLNPNNLFFKKSRSTHFVSTKHHRATHG